MKRALLIIAFFLLILGCKNDHHELITEENEINLLRADFEKRIGYDESKVYMLTPSFRSKINWNKTVSIDKDTILIAVDLLDTVLFPINDQQINLKKNVVLKAVRNEKSEWSYATVTFVPTSLSKGYSGLIISRSLLNNLEKVDYYNEGSILNDNFNIRRKFALTIPKKTTNAGTGLQARCIYGLVNGGLNVISCDNNTWDTGGASGQDTYGNPKDYEQMPIFDGEGSPPESSFTPEKEDQEIIDSLQGYPCAQAVLANIPYLENKVSKWLNDIFKNSTDFDIIFRVGRNLAGTNEDGNHVSSGTMYKQKHIISINPDVLGGSSKEYIAATMFHEALHGFLNFEFTRLANENKSEQFGILYSGWLPQTVGNQRKFVKNHASFGTQLDELATAIRSFNPNMSPYDAMAIAKGGVVNLDAIESSVNKNHRNGAAGTLCK